jgi:hypothetical protein
VVIRKSQIIIIIIIIKREPVTAQALRAVKVPQGSDTLEEWICGAHTMGLNAGPRYRFEVAKAW